MTIQTTLLKNDRQRAVLHLYGSAPGDSTSISLLFFRRAEEVALSTTSQLAVNISNAYSNAPTVNDCSITVRRGGSSGTVVLDLHGFTEYPGNQQLPSLSQDNTSSIHVLFEASGMLVLDLRKVAGYTGPDTNVGV